MAERKVITFDNHELDSIRGELRRDGVPVDVEPKVFDFLQFVAERQGRVISRDELIEGIWGGRIVSDAAVASCISSARAVLGDNGRDQRIIRTLSRKGILFVPSTSVEGEQNTEPTAGPTAKSDRLTIVVLPFRNLTTSSDQEYFSEGIAEDILTSLAQFEELVVIARQTAFAFDSESSDSREFADLLGARFALEGSVQRAGERVRISAQLIDVPTRETLWANRFDRDTGDIFAVQDEITGVIVNTLVGQLSGRHVVELSSQAPRQFGAYDHLLKAQQLAWSMAREEIATARAEVTEAIAVEPDFARAHALLAWVSLTEDGAGWGRTGKEQFEESLAHARIAVALDDKNPWAHSMLGTAMFWRDLDVERGLAECRLGVSLNPSNAHLRMFLGALLAYVGDGTAAIEELNRAIDLNPLFPSLYLVHRARAYCMIEDYPAALSDSTRAASALTRHPAAHAMLASCQIANGKVDEARDTVAKLTTLSSKFTLSFARETFPYVHDADRERFIGHLAEAGLSD